MKTFSCRFVIISGTLHIFFHKDTFAVHHFSSWMWHKNLVLKVKCVSSDYFLVLLDVRLFI